MQSFLVSLCMAILEKFITKGTLAFEHYLALKAELEKNQALADKYQQTVNKPTTREERKNAEDDALN